MSRLSASLGSLAFFFLAPGTVAGLGPWWINGWRVRGAFSPAWLAPAVGAALIVLGLAVVGECFARFAWVGRGTPAPVAPTQRLIVSGLYRRVRNPIYVGVVAIVLGQAALFADWRLAVYAALVWLGFHLFVLLYEEPTLRHAYPQDYARFSAAVPRWRPRLRPWPGP